MNALALALLYLPTVLQGVVAVEAALNGAPGATKKQAVLSAVAAAAAVGETAPNQHVQVISTLIDQVVSTLNKTGWFAPKKAAAAAA